MEESLRITRDKYVKLFLGSPDAIMISDLKTGVFIEVNDATSDIFGYSRDETIGKSEPELGIWPKRREGCFSSSDKYHRVGKTFRGNRMP